MGTERTELADRVKELKALVAGKPEQVHSVSMNIQNRSVLPWLNQQTSVEKFYWRDREGRYELAGHGMAFSLKRKPEGPLETFLSAMDSFLKTSHEDLRLYGGVAFDDQQEPVEEWDAFSTGYFFVPLVELRSHGGGTTLFLHANGNSIEKLDEALADVFNARVVEPGVPPPVSRHDEPSQDRWSRMIGSTLKSFQTKGLEKVVLARKARYRFDDELDPLLMLDRLQGQTANCFYFLFQPAKKTAFMGASPERLFSLASTQVQTEAIAGTRPRGSTERIDQGLSTRLLNSPKDRHEHEFVRSQIRTILDSQCEEVQSDPEPRLLKLSRGQHLYSGFSARLSDGFSATTLLTALHPTPAVGGVPTERALALIREEEAFSRGWYAAPVGWMGRDRAEFAVAIRSGLIHGAYLDLYSGAGIVEGSDSDEEWSEIENKISDFIHILTQP